ncbi:protein kinase domain-containing protein [Marinitoga aeolica]|uniref:Protein kinase n=1 Tax=Marinitoga aeolica TaxID=2809031 RepID=A0ABY8PRE6_9BACT|nr:protein kinase [Marinitoga aeolica]WGS65190.1 protein kinase [Marinitoga aeolica]
MEFLKKLLNYNKSVMNNEKKVIENNERESEKNNNVITTNINENNQEFNENVNENKKEQVAENVLKIIKNGKEFLVPAEISGRYIVQDILSANSGFGLILIAEDKVLFGRKVLIKSNNYKNKIKRTNLDSKEIIEKRRKDIEIEKAILLALKKMNIPNIPVLCNYVKGYAPTINWPDGKIIPGKQFLNELAYDEPYIVMQYIDGDTISDYIKNNNIDRESPYWQMFVLKLAKQLLKTFKDMHKGNSKGAKFVYQDLKPDNIIASPNNTFTLIDLGGVAIINPNGKFINRGVGTPGYMAPEIKDRNLPFDGRADIYTLGVMMYDLFTEENLSNYTNEKGIANLDYSKLNIHQSIVKIIEKASQKDINKRYLDCKEMLNDVFIALRNVSSAYHINSSI